MRFAGYAALFNRPDKGGDIIRKGAFAETLAKGAAVPLLWQHRPGVPIGWVEHVSEDGRGLRVIASVGGGEDARRAAALLRRRKVDGLSFGYRVRDAGRDGPWRSLRRLDLVEISLVADPMQPGARVHAVEEEESEDGGGQGGQAGRVVRGAGE